MQSIGVGKALASPPSGRVEDWRANMRVRWRNSMPFGMGLSPAPIIPFPAPATSNRACGFPAPGFPVEFTTKVMRPIDRERFQVTAGQRGSSQTSQVVHRAMPYSTSSSRSPQAGVPASNVALSSSRPNPSHTRNTDWSGQYGSN